MAGAPIGNQNAAKGRRWSKAVERALDAWPEKAVSLEVNRGVDQAAYEFVAKLMGEKDLGFFKELGDRLDGKPAQAIGGDDDLPPIKTLSELLIRGIDATDNRPSDEGA